MICETKKMIIYEMRKRGVLPFRIMSILNVKNWQVTDANKKYRAKFESKENKVYPVNRNFRKAHKVIQYPELTGISAPLYTPYGTALTIGDVKKR
jgi:hypothetical protein